MEQTAIKLLEILEKLKQDLQHTSCTGDGKVAIRKCIDIVRIRLEKVINQL